MGWIDTRNEFCDAVALNTGAAGTYNIGSQIPLPGGNGGDWFGGGPPVSWIVIVVAEAITVASSTGTVSFQLASDSTQNLATNGTQTVHWRLGDFATSTSPIPAGTVLGIVAFPAKGKTYEEFVGLQQVTGTTAIATGKLDAFVTIDPSRWRAHPNAI